MISKDFKFFPQIKWKERLKIKFNLWTACIHIRKVLSSFTVFDLNYFLIAYNIIMFLYPGICTLIFRSFMLFKCLIIYPEPYFFMWSLCEVHRFKFWISLNVKCIYQCPKSFYYRKDIRRNCPESWRDALSFERECSFKEAAMGSKCPYQISHTHTHSHMNSCTKKWN